MTHRSLTAGVQSDLGVVAARLDADGALVDPTAFVNGRDAVSPSDCLYGIHE